MPIAEGVATTLTPVTVGCTAVVVTATAADPAFVESCVEVALMVSEPETGAEEGAV
jgi:hypothetical protein